MTIHAVVWAWDQVGLPAEEKLLLLALADLSTDDGPEPDVGYAFAKAELDTDRGHELLADLEDRGLIDAQYRTIER